MRPDIHPLTPERWDDLVDLFGPERGANSGCWCMWWRISSKEFQTTGGASKRAQLEALVARGAKPGLLAYVDGSPVGWVAVAPRSQYSRLERSTKLYPVDDAPVWAISCFYIHRAHRRQGITEALCAAAVDYAAAQGAEQVEAYPIDTSGGKRASADLFTGKLATFLAAGFTEVARRAGRPIVRKKLR
jgi:GNAT superfamily N-acetyltransferase